MATIPIRCTQAECPLKNQCLNPISTLVMPNAQGQVHWVIVGESPDHEDIDTGMSFEGTNSSMILKSALKRFAPPDLGLAFTHYMRTQPMGENGKRRAPNAKETRCCQQHFIHDIEQIQPLYGIVWLGTWLANEIAGTPIGAGRGRLRQIQIGTRNYHSVVTYSPQQCMGRPAFISAFDADLKRTFRGFPKLYDFLPKEQHQCSVLNDMKSVEQFFDWLGRGLTKQHMVSMDYEAYGLGIKTNQLISSQWSVDGTTGYVVPLCHPESPFGNDPKDPTIERIRQLHANVLGKEASFGYTIGHNLMFEAIQTQREFGVVPITSTFLDTQAGIFLLDENVIDIHKDGDPTERPMDLKWALDYHWGFDGYDTPEMLEALDYRSRGDMASLKWPILCQYGALDATANWHHFMGLWQLAKEADYEQQWWNLLRGLFNRGIKFFANTTYNGFWINQEVNDFLHSDKGLVEKEYRAISKTLNDSPYVHQLNEQLFAETYGGMQATSWDDDEPEDNTAMLVDLNKPEHQARLFFDTMKLQPVSWSEKTKKPSCDKDFQEAYAHIPEVKVYTDLQATKKLFGTYIKKIRNHLNQDGPDSDGRIRPSFTLNWTVTGRTSSYEPNMQQIPRGQTELRTYVRKQFACPPGTVLVSGDYMTNEVRFWGQESGDPALCKLFWDAKRARDAFRADPTNKELEKRAHDLGDVHYNTASLMYGVPRNDVTSQMRQDTKTITFGVMYGRGIASMAAQVNIERKEMARRVDMFFEPFSVAKQWIQDVATTARALGYVQDTFGKRRRLPGALSGIDFMMAAADRQACNSPIQHTASSAALYANSCFFLDYVVPNKFGIWLPVNSVHDSFSFQIPIEDITEFVHASEPYFTNLLMDGLRRDFGTTMLIPPEIEYEVGFDLSYKVKWDFTEPHLQEIQDLMLWWDKTNRWAGKDEALLAWSGPMGDATRAKAQAKKAA